LDSIKFALIKRALIKRRGEFPLIEVDREVDRCKISLDHGAERYGGDGEILRNRTER